MIICDEIISIEILEEENIWYDISNFDERCIVGPNFIADDIIVHNSGGVDEYIANRLNPLKAKRKLDKISKDLWPILEETFGIMLYQEQIMTIMQKIGNFTMEEADKGRKILKLLHKGNQDKTDAFYKLMDKFKNNALAKDMSESGVEEILDTMASYTEYSFNKCLSSDTEVITKNGTKKINEVKEGETVLSYNFEKDVVYETNVKKVHKNGRKLIYEFETEGGKKVKCTIDHKFLCEDGKMRSLKDIIENDYKIIEVL